MNKIVRRVLMIAVPVVVFVLGILIYSYYPMMTMKPAATGPVADTNIYSIRININSVYFVRTDDGYIMVDAGMDAGAMETALPEAGINADEVRWILLTHSDYDHVASLPLFSRAEICMSQEEFGLISGVEKRSPGGGNTVPEGVDINKITLVQDGREMLCGGIRVECFLAPGHTPGSMVYLIDGAYLFTGDAFKVSKGKAVVHPYSMNTKLSQETIGRLNEPVNRSRLVLTAHYGVHNTVSMGQD